MNSAARIEAFLEMMSVERGAADNTLASYRRDLEDASAAIKGGLANAGSRRHRAPISAIWPREVSPPRPRRANFRRSGSSSSSSMPKICVPTIRRARWTVPGKERSLPKTMAEAETGRLLDRAALEAAEAGKDGKAGDAVAAKRMHALVEVLYATGLRVSELVSLPVTVAQRDERFFVVRGKGNKERMVPLSPKAREAMRAWLAERERQSGAEGQPLPVSLAVRERISAAAGFRARSEGAGGPRRHCRGKGLAARAAPRLRQPSAAERRRSQGRPAVARPRRHIDDPDLHPCAGGKAGAAGQRPSPACRPDAVTLCEAVFHGPEQRFLQVPRVSRSGASVRSRMYNYLDFEKPVQDLEGKILELKKLSESGEAVDVADEIARLEKRVQDALREIYKSLDSVAEGPGGAPCGPAALPRLRQGAVFRLHAARRRPQIRRGRGDRRRFRPFPRRAGGGDRPGEGFRHQKPAEAQFRLGPAGGLPQGGAHHGTGRPLQGADDLAGRHGGRLSRHRRGRTRPGRSHRPLHLGLPGAEDTDHVRS